VVAWWRLRAEADPLSTSRALGLMQAMIRAGDPTDALKHFQAHAALVRAELDCLPSKELTALAESVNGGTSVLGAISLGLSKAARLRVGGTPAGWNRRAGAVQS